MVRWEESIRHAYEERLRRFPDDPPLGWRLLYSPRHVLTGATAAFIGLNPGGAALDPTHGGVLFGDPNQYNAEALKAIAAGTHNGKFMTAHTAEKLGEVFRGAAGHRGRFAKGEATAFVIDASGSMFSERMDGRPRMQVVKSAMYGLIAYKQANWS